MTDEVLDILIVGGGPVGLHAGFKAGLLNLRAIVVDKGRKWSRAYYVPKFHSIPFSPEGLSGRALIEGLRKALGNVKDFVRVEDFVAVEGIEREADIFKSRGVYHPTKTARVYRSKVVILATGITDRQPLIGGELKTILPYANKGLVHYCIICDGNLARGQNVAVIGHERRAAFTALDLMHFQPRAVNILTDGKKLFEGELTENPDDLRELRKTLESEGVKVVEEKILGLFGLETGVFGVKLAGGREMSFDRAFIALGLYKMNNELAVQLGGRINEEGYILVDGDCRVLDENGSPVPGLYAIGDINSNWNQIMVGFGDAERAVIHAFAEYL